MTNDHNHLLLQSLRETAKVNLQADALLDTASCSEVSHRKKLEMTVMTKSEAELWEKLG